MPHGRSAKRIPGRRDSGARCRWWASGTGRRTCRRGNGSGRCGGGAVAPAGTPALEAKQGGIFRSDDKGKTWKLVSNCDARPLYFSQVRVDPTNPDIVYLSDLPVNKSVDGGKTFFELSSTVHSDQHARWIDPKNSNHLLVGSDGGLYASWDQGLTWDFINTMTTSLAYVVTADMRRPYDVFIGLQDNGSWGGPSSTRAGGIFNSDWYGLCSSGDGFYTAVDPDRPWIVYTESQNGKQRAAQWHRRLQEWWNGHHRAAPGGCRKRGEAGALVVRARRRWRGWRCRWRWRWRWPRQRAERGNRARRRTASTGTHRSSSRHTTRTSSGSAATACSSRTTAATPTSRART